MIQRIAVALLLAFPGVALADSPLTSTPFSEAYRDQPAVTKAERTHVLDDELCRLLANPKVPIDVRAAVINALGWNFDGQHNAAIFRDFLARKYSVNPEKVDSKLSADEMFAIGYLLAMDNYFEPEDGLPFLHKARKKKKKSYTVAMVTALVEAQAAFDTSWCESWKSYLRAEQQFQPDRRDLRPEAQPIVDSYMQLYSEECG